MAHPYRIPAARQARFHDIAARLDEFGQAHLDEELTGFLFELWARLCRRKSDEVLRGKPEVWAAAVVHVIARINFLFDRNQPVHLTFDTICDYFGTSKKTVSPKATAIERTLKLQPHSEPGLTRAEVMELFTMIQLSNGLVLTFSQAKQMGIVPPDARVEDLR